MKKCQACGRTLKSTNAAYCRQCYRAGHRVWKPRPVDESRNLLLLNWGNHGR